MLLDPAGNAHVNVLGLTPFNAQELDTMCPTNTFSETKFEAPDCLMLGAFEKLVTTLFLENAIFKNRHSNDPH